MPRPRGPKMPRDPAADPSRESARKHDDLRRALRPSADPIPPGIPDPPRGFTPFDIPKLSPGRIPLDRIATRPLRGDVPKWPSLEPQRLIPVETSPNIEEGLEARVKDPLWFLARQWQTGEFESEDGGRLAQIEATWRSIPVTTLTRGQAVDAIDLALPLEAAVEAEAADGSSPAWRPAQLEYAFTLQAGSSNLVASEYDGTHLDWYHFDLLEGAMPAVQPTVTRILPRNLRFQGMPHPRWWRFEPGDVELTRISTTQPNQLQLLLAEFMLVDSNNWYVVPLDLPAGHLRHVDRVRAVDAFGVTRELPPALGPTGGNNWELFSLAPEGPPGDADGSWFYVPHAAVNVTEADAVEEVEFIRDEVANMGWAVERYYTDAAGALVNRADEEGLAVGGQADGIADPASLPPEVRDLDIFRLVRAPARNWIPYLPRRAPSRPATAAPEVYMRRGRTDPTATRAFPQHRTRIVAECWRLNEEELPRTGVAVSRRWRYARRTDGSLALWIGRRKELRSTERSAGVDFDFLMSPG